MPSVEVPGDNESTIDIYAGDNDGGPVRRFHLRPNIMARSGTCIGMNPTLAVWRFGILGGSEAWGGYGVCIPETPSVGVTHSNEPYGFLWVIATRKTGKIRDTFRGYALELPDKFRKIIDWEYPKGL